MSIQETKLAAIADAIREKDGTTGPIPAKSFPERIRAIPTMPEGSFTITVLSNDPPNGTVSGGGIVSKDMMVTVKAEAGDRYNFLHWEENGVTVSRDAEYTFTVTEDRTLVAAFKEMTVSRLPEGYTEVEYVSNGDPAYANIGMRLARYLRSTTDRLILDAGITVDQNRASQQSIIQQRTSNTAGNTNISGYLSIYKTNGVWKMVFSWGKFEFTHTLPETPTGQRFHIDIDMVSGQCTINDETFQMDASTKGFGTGSMYLFSGNPGGSRIYICGLNLYSYKLYEGDELMEHEVPCIDPSEEAGTYDLVNSVFRKPSYGTFTAGNPV